MIVSIADYIFCRTIFVLFFRPHLISSVVRPGELPCDRRHRQYPHLEHRVRSRHPAPDARQAGGQQRHHSLVHNRHRVRTMALTRLKWKTTLFESPVTFWVINQHIQLHSYSHSITGMNQGTTFTFPVGQVRLNFHMPLKNCIDYNVSF